MDVTRNGQGFGRGDRPPIAGGRSKLTALGGLLALGLALAPSLATPERAAAQVQPCSKVYSGQPLTQRNPGRPPLILGDSVVGFSIFQLQVAGFRVNAEGCRSFNRGVKLIHRMARRGQALPRLVILSLGTAGTVRLSQVRQALRGLGPNRKLGLVTPRAFFSGKARPGARVMRQAARRWGNRVVLYDWARHSQGRDNWFFGDAVHPNEVGVIRFANLLSQRTFNEPYRPPGR